MAKAKSRRVRRDDIVSNLRELQEKMTEYTGTLQAIDLPNITEEQKKAGEEGLTEFESIVDDAKSGLEELRDEIQAWRDNLPEGLSNSDKAQALEDCVSELDSAVNTLDGFTWPGWQEEIDEAEVEALCEVLDGISSDVDTACDEADGAEFPSMFG